MCAAPREILPTRRKCVSQKVKVDRQTVHYSIGLYPDGRPGELFIEVAKAGAALRTWAGEAAMMLSVALQYGTPLDVALNLFIGSRSEPNGKVIGHPCILRCSSIMDLIARDLAITFLDRMDLADIQNCQPCMIVESVRDARSTMDSEARRDISLNETTEPAIDIKGMCKSPESNGQCHQSETPRLEGSDSTSSTILLDQA